MAKGSTIKGGGRGEGVIHCLVPPYLSSVGAF